MIHVLPERMRHVNIYLLKDDTPAVSALLAGFGWFDPTMPDKQEQFIGKPDKQEYAVLYSRARKRYDKITHFIGAPEVQEPSVSDETVSYQELQKLDERLGELWQRCSSCEERQRKLQEELKRVIQLQNTLQHYKELNVNLDKLHRPHVFLDVRLGTIPLSEVNKVRDSIVLNNYKLMVFEQQENTAHVIIAGDKSQSHNVEKVLNAASFRITRLPDEFRDYPEKLEQDLLNQVASLRQQQQALTETIALTFQNYSDLLREARRTLNFASAYAELSSHLGGKGALSQVQGWVPLNKLGELELLLEERLGSHFVLQSRAPAVSERKQVPSCTTHPNFLSPFASLVSNYGVPRYGEFDPTWLFAVSYILMFGMMFGDVGHGLVIAAAGLFLRGKLAQYRYFFVAIGISSFLFGFVYGSLFGFENIIEPAWVSPLHNPVLMLVMALVWGALFLTLMLLLSIRNEWVDGKRLAAFIGGHGLAGLMLYIGLLLAGWQVYKYGMPQAWIYFLLAGALLSLLIHSWRTQETSGLERLVVMLVEALETVVGYFSNTLSFLRVAAFSINHVALIVAVFTVANMFEGAGEWAVVISGNIFVLILEGAIVAIQALRLEYYEGFSRFYRGDGVRFTPLRFGDAA